MGFVVEYMGQTLSKYKAALLFGFAEETAIYTSRHPRVCRLIKQGV